MPSSLPAKLFAEAYTADDPSLPVVVAGINKIADPIPLRASSKLLKPKWAAASMRRGHEQAFQACTPSVVEKPPEAKCESIPLAPVKTEHVAACLHIDDDEAVLKLEHALKLAKLRAAKSVTLVKEEPTGDGVPSGTLRLNRNLDGNVTLIPRAPTPAAAPPSTPATIEHDVITHAVKACSDDGAMITVDNLDPICQKCYRRFGGESGEEEGGGI